MTAPLNNLWLPHDADAHDYAPQKVSAQNLVLSAQPTLAPLPRAKRFSYLGKGFTLEGFEQYVKGYNFGSVPPSYLILHHTAVPAASWADGGQPISKWWDRNEAGLSDELIYTKRKRQLDGLRDYYLTLEPPWPSGPHLFIDDKWVWVFTPMYDVGTHARSGNSYRVAGKLYYSIGLEVVGDFTHKVWPDPVRALVYGAVKIVRERINTFEIMFRAGAGGVSSHRNWGKPACPGNAITEDYYLQALRGG